MKIRVSTPTRIDLAGGTLDIYPLYVFEGGGITVNCAVNLQSTVEIAPRRDHRVELHSADLGLDLSASCLEELIPQGPLELLARAVKFCAPAGGFTLVTENRVPKGSGLGASSSLLVAVMYGLMKYSGKSVSPGILIDWCANVEAQSLGIPTGKQDYYAAYYGGISAIHFDARGIRREALKPGRPFMAHLKESLILSYTGISHFSGATNWDMMKSYIDDRGQTRAHMKRINERASRMREVLLAEDPAGLSAALKEEWESRKRLAEGVTNDRIDAMITAAHEAGASASKICGAGAGGCMITLAGRGKRKEVEKALQAAGAEIIPFALQAGGVRMTAE